MFAVMTPPIFGSTSSSQAAAAVPVLPPTAFSPYRPVKPSPLSSSPIRAFSPSHDDGCSSPMRASSPIRMPSSPPASTRLLSQHDTQSSPIQPSSSAPTVQPFTFSAFNPFVAPQGPPPAVVAAPAAAAAPSQPPAKTPPFRFSACPARNVPRLQNRDANRQTRRSLFLRNVRQRADDRSYDRRNLEQELQKLEWWSLEKEIREAKEADAMSMLTENDFDDAAEWIAQPSSLRGGLEMDIASSGQAPSHGYLADNAFDDGDDDRYDARYDANDERMAELLAQEEEADLEAMIASMEAEEPFEANEARPVETPQVQAQHQPEPEPEPMLSQTATSGQSSRPESMAFSDDGDYDAIFAELMSQQQQQSGLDSDDMDMA